VAPEVRDEHRRAIEWLNNKTIDEVSFFLVRPEALSINGSPPALRFNPEAAPSQFSRRLRGATQSENSPWRDFCRNSWEDLYSYFAALGHSWAQKRSVTSGHYIYWTVGKSGVTVNVTLDKATSRISVSICLESEAAKRQFDVLVGNQANIEADFGAENLHWERRDEKKWSSVFVDHPYDRDKISEATPDREALFSWIEGNVTKFRNIAKRYLVDGQSY